MNELVFASGSEPQTAGKERRPATIPLVRHHLNPLHHPALRVVHFDSTKVVHFESTGDTIGQWKVVTRGLVAFGGGMDARRR